MQLLKKRRSVSFLGIPGYAAIPFWIDLVFNMLTYYGTRLINTGRYHHDLATALDQMIPANGWWIPVYFASYAFWALGYILVAREDENTCFRLLGGNMICKILCAAIFLLAPTTIARPEITGTGLDDMMLKLLYWMDSPDNLLPSMHCYMSWYACRWLGRRKGRSPVGLALSYLFCFMIFYSTLATRQHYILDVFAGVAVAELGLALEKRLRPGRFYAWIDRRIQD